MDHFDFNGEAIFRCCFIFNCPNHFQLLLEITLRATSPFTTRKIKSIFRCILLGILLCNEDSEAVRYWSRPLLTCQKVTSFTINLSSPITISKAAFQQHLLHLSDKMNRWSIYITCKKVNAYLLLSIRRIFYFFDRWKTPYFYKLFSRKWDKCLYVLFPPISNSHTKIEFDIYFLRLEL